MSHCVVNNVLHPAQKGCARGQLGCVDHLLLNSRIWHQVKSKNRSLAVAWLDYKKAYDSVPHNWIIQCLKMFHFHPTIVNCIEGLLPLWSSTMFLQLPSSAPMELMEVSIKCGIYQGDSLSPLLFCISLTPLSLLLDPLDGYQVTATEQLNHLVYMDDLKLFAKNNSQLHVLLRTVKMFSDDVGLVFGLDKCAKFTVTRGKASQTGDVQLEPDSIIRELNVGESYKYLGFFESEGLDCNVSKELILQEYLRRLSLIWKSSLSGPRKVRGTNSFCVPVLSYGFAIIPWTKKEVEQFDVLTRKTLTSTLSHHPRSAVERLYLPRSAAGRGLVNIEHLFYRKLVSICHHLFTSADPLVGLCCELDHSLPSRISVISRGRAYCSGLSLSLDLTSGHPDKRAIRAEQLSTLKSSLLSKPLHGKYATLLRSDSVDGSGSSKWLQQHLHSESESTVIAIQDQVIATRVYEAKIMNKSIPSLLCRVCGQAEETILHLLSSCPSLAVSTYLYRHNLVASVLHWHLSKMYSFPLRATSWFTHKPQPVVENSNAKLLWDFSLVSASHHPSNRPDIVLFDYQNKKILFIEVSCPADPHVLAKEDEKIQKYCALASDFRIMYQMPVKIIPVVIGHSGVISSQCRRYLHDIPG